MRIEVSRDGEHVEQSALTEGWLDGTTTYHGGPENIA